MMRNAAEDARAEMNARAARALAIADARAKIAEARALLASAGAGAFPLALLDKAARIAAKLYAIRPAPAPASAPNARR